MLFLIYLSMHTRATLPSSDINVENGSKIDRRRLEISSSTMEKGGMNFLTRRRLVNAIEMTRKDFHTKGH